MDDGYIFFLKGSQVNEDDLARSNIAEAKAVALLADTVKSGNLAYVDGIMVLAALTTKSLNPDIQITAELVNPGNSERYFSLAITL